MYFYFPHEAKVAYCWSYFVFSQTRWVKGITLRNKNFFIIMMFYCGLMVHRHITDTRTQKVVSYTQGRGNRPPHPPAGGGPAMSRGPATVAILLLFYFFNFENYNLYFHDQMPRAPGWNRGGGINSTILATLCCTKAFSNLQAWKRK